MDAVPTDVLMAIAKSGLQREVNMLACVCKRFHACFQEIIPLVVEDLFSDWANAAETISKVLSYFRWWKYHALRFKDPPQPVLDAVEELEKVATKDSNDGSLEKCVNKIFSWDDHFSGIVVDEPHLTSPFSLDEFLEHWRHRCGWNNSDEEIYAPLVLYDLLENGMIFFHQRSPLHLAEVIHLIENSPSEPGSTETPSASFRLVLRKLGSPKNRKNNSQVSQNEDEQPNEDTDEDDEEANFTLTPNDDLSSLPDLYLAVSINAAPSDSSPPGRATNFSLAYALTCSKPQLETDYWSKTEILLLALYARARDALYSHLPGYVPVRTYVKKFENSGYLETFFVKSSDLLQMPLLEFIEEFNKICNGDEFSRYDGHFCAHSCGELWARPFLDMCYFLSAAPSTWDISGSASLKERDYSVTQWDVTLEGIESLALATDENEETRIGFTGLFLQRMPNIHYSGDREGVGVFYPEQFEGAASLISHVKSYHKTTAWEAGKRVKETTLVTDSNYTPHPVVSDPLIQPYLTRNSVRFTVSRFCQCGRCLKPKSMKDVDFKHLDCASPFHYQVKSYTIVLVDFISTGARVALVEFK